MHITTARNAKHSLEYIRRRAEAIDVVRLLDSGSKKSILVRRKNKYIKIDTKNCWHKILRRIKFKI